jgi:hypothetical protein
MPGKQAKAVTPPMLKRMLRRVSHSSFPLALRGRQSQADPKTTAKLGEVLD